MLRLRCRGGIVQNAGAPPFRVAKAWPVTTGSEWRISWYKWRILQEVIARSDNICPSNANFTADRAGALSCWLRRGSCSTPWPAKCIESPASRSRTDLQSKESERKTPNFAPSITPATRCRQALGVSRSAVHRWRLSRKPLESGVDTAAISSGIPRSRREIGCHADRWLRDKRAGRS